MGLTPVLWLPNWPLTCSDMDIATTARNARVETDSADPGLSPGMYDDEQERLTPEQEQVKKLTGFTMDHLQALRHLRQRAELCRKAQK